MSRRRCVPPPLWCIVVVALFFAAVHLVFGQDRVPDLAKQYAEQGVPGVLLGVFSIVLGSAGAILYTLWRRYVVMQDLMLRQVELQQAAAMALTEKCIASLTRSESIMERCEEALRGRG